MDSGRPFIHRFSWELSLLLPWRMRPRSCDRGTKRLSAIATARMNPEKNIARKCANCRNIRIDGGRFPVVRKTQMPSSLLPQMRTRDPKKPIEPRNHVCKRFLAAPHKQNLSLYFPYILVQTAKLKTLLVRIIAAGHCRYSR